MRLKFIGWLVCALVCNFLHAGNVSLSRAEHVARIFFENHDGSRSGTPQLQLVWNGEQAGSRAGQHPAFYVFNRTDREGFVIVAGDDVASPVLGYSFTDPFVFEGLPLNVRTWLLGYRHQIQSVREGELEARSLSAAWSRKTDVGEEVVALETAKWGQDAPFNRYCPTVNGQQTLTGCTATALSIILRYHQWPSQGTGTLPAYQYTVNGSTYSVDEHELGHAYNWTRMPLSLENASEEDYHQIATLMYDCGVMVQSEYMPEETGSSASHAATGLIEHMSYSLNTSYAYRSMYRDATWYEKLKDELRNNGPVFYAGTHEDNTGHAFVLDGFTTADYFHVNWGWEGRCNGYYLLSGLAPDPDENGQAKAYAYNQCAIFGLRQADQSEQPKDELVLMRGQYDGVTYNGLSLSSYNLLPGESFTASVGMIANAMTRPFKGTVAISLVDRSGNWIQDVNQSILQLEDLGTNQMSLFKEVPCLIQEDYGEDSYLIVRYQKDGSEEWHQMEGGEGVEIQVALSPYDYTDDGQLLYLEPGEYDGISYNGITANLDSIWKGKEFEVGVGLMNVSAGKGFRGRAHLCLFNKNKELKEVLEESVISVSGPGQVHGYGLTLRRTITKYIEKGDYLALCYQVEGATTWTEVRGYKNAVDRLYLKGKTQDQEEEEEQEEEPNHRLASATSLTYNKQDRIITVKTETNVQYQLKKSNSAGEVIAEGTSNADGKFSFSTSSLGRGNYRLELTCKDQQMEVTIIL